MNIEKAKEEIQQLANKLKAELDAPEWPQDDDTYWTIDISTTRVCKYIWCGTKLDRFRKSLGWVFRTEAKAQKHLDMLQATERVKQYIAKANRDAGWAADFNDMGQLKRTWGYDHDMGKLFATNTFVGQKSKAWKYINPELFDQLVADCRDDLLLILGAGDES